MNNNKFSSNIFSGGMLLKGSTKMDSTLIIEQERLCNTCKNYKGSLNCRVLGKIKNPDTAIHCSWWKEKSSKPKTKRCSYCGELKTIDKFYRNKANPDGHQGKCIKCALIYGTEYQRKDKKVKLNNVRGYRSLK